MSESENQSRLVRISNCLQTILELESKLETLELGQSLLDEFSVLKSFLEKIDTVSVEEEDVERIEAATASFLKELREPLAKMGEEGNVFRKLQ